MRLPRHFQEVGVFGRRSTHLSAPTSEFYQSWYDFYPLYAAKPADSVGRERKVDVQRRGGNASRTSAAVVRPNLAGKETYNGDSFADGTAPWPSLVRGSANYKGKVDWGVVPLPTSKGNTSAQIPTQRCEERRYVRSCKNRATAWAFLQYSPASLRRQVTEHDRSDADAKTSRRCTRVLRRESGLRGVRCSRRPCGRGAECSNSIQVWQVFRDDWSSR